MPSISQRSATASTMDMTNYLLLASDTKSSINSNEASCLNSSQRSTFSVNSPSIIGRKRSAGAAKPQSNSVHFDPLKDSVLEVWSRHTISREQASEIWYTLGDIKVIQSKINTAIRMMKSGRFNEDMDESSEKSYTFRGIQTEREKRKRRERVAKHHMELFWCHGREYFEMTHLPLKLQELSQTAINEAILRAKRDQEEAFKIYISRSTRRTQS